MGHEQIRVKKGSKASQRSHFKPGNVPMNTNTHQSPQMQHYRDIGNETVQRMMEAGVIQAKLKIGQPNDKYEQEADRVADQVMRMVEPKQSLVNGHSSLVQREATCPECMEDEEGIQTKPLAEQITPLVQRQVVPEEEEEEEEIQTKLLTDQNTSFVQRQVEAEEEEEEEEPIQTKLMESTRVQRQLDEEEEEEGIQAKPLADQNTPFVQRQVDTEEEEEEEETIQTKLMDGTRVQRQFDEEEENPRVSPVKSGGNPLPAGVRSFMEKRIGFDFDGVRIHNDTASAESSKRIGAAAYTSGKDIYFGAGRYQPDTMKGKELIAHELTHVVQQTKARMKKSLNTDNRGESNARCVREVDGVAHNISRKSGNDGKNKIASSISPYNNSSVQLAPNVTGVTISPAEIAAGRGRTTVARATAARGTNVTWSIDPPAHGAAIVGRGRRATITAPAGSTGGVITIRAADAANPADFATATLTLVELRNFRFNFNPGMPAWTPANTMEASVCNNTATAQVDTVPVGRVVQWSIRGNRRGAAIDPATGVINPSATQTGNIRVRGRDNAVRDAFAEEVLTIRAHPTGIRRTGRPPVALANPYGATYTHTLRSSGGSLNNVWVTERVFSGNDPFNTGFVPIPPGNINAPLNAAGEMDDEIGTPSGIAGIDVNRFLPSPPNPGLPQVLSTPQILYWRSEQCTTGAAAVPAVTDHWVPFTNVAITATLLRQRGRFRFVTRDNGVPFNERYRGPDLVTVSRVRFNPPRLAADNNPATTSDAAARVTPATTALQWSFQGLNLGASIVNPTPGAGNPAVIRTGNIAGRVTLRATAVGHPLTFAEGRLRLQEVSIGAIRFRPASIRPGAGNTTRATVRTTPRGRNVDWSIVLPNLGCAIVRNADNSATITRGAPRGRITVRATDQRDAAKFNEVSLVLR